MIDVIICTHNPRRDFLVRTLDALKAQSMDKRFWRLLIIDNASNIPVVSWVDLKWHPNGKVLKEERVGLTAARLSAIAASDAEFLIWSDDDNLLRNDYLEEAYKFLLQNPRVGIVGGKSIPEYEQDPPSWYKEGIAPIGCRDLGEAKLIANASLMPKEYPPFAPIGAGMVCRRLAILPWCELVKGDPQRMALGRSGAALTSGEDNDICLTALRNGWDLAYIPNISLTHLIPPQRLTIDYQKRIARASFRDFVTVLDLHGIRPWSSISRWSVWPRALISWCKNRVWEDPKNAVLWSGVLGQYEGRAKLR